MNGRYVSRFYSGRDQRAAPVGAAVNSPGASAPGNPAARESPVKGDTFRTSICRPIRGYRFRNFDIQGLAPLAIHCRPSRALSLVAAFQWRASIRGGMGSCTQTFALEPDED